MTARWLLAGLCLCACAALAPRAADAAAVTGVVVDRAGKPVEFANVSVPSLRKGTVTDDQGRFSLDLPEGPVAIEVTQIGYERVRLAVQAGPRLAPLRVTLADEPVPVAEVVVHASSYGKAAKSEGATLRRMDVVMTPGGAADLFQSLRALPGINAPNEGAAVYVRGGDPHETLIRIDGLEIGHPYHYEGASGGLFSSFPSYLLRSAFFSSGGFGAKHGGALSGVLEVETEDPANLKTVSLGANMVGVDASATWSLVPDRLSATGTARFTRTALLNRLYGSASDYVSVPQSADGAAKLLYRYSPTGRLSALYLGSGDGIEVVSRRLNYDGVYTGHARNHFAAIQLRDAFGRAFAVRGQASVQRYTAGSSYGVLDVRAVERAFAASVDATWEASARHQVTFGAGTRRLTAERGGVHPADSTDYAPGAGTRAQSGAAVATTPGLYVEDKMRVWGPLYATIGVRADHASTSREWTLDPRAALAWRIGDHQTLRVAGGRYHELPPTRDLDPAYGNPELEPMRADHLVAGYEWVSSFHTLRLEAFRKDYGNLVTVSPDTWFANDGHGYARGVDVFVQSTNRRLGGWISYGYLDTRRKEGDDPRMLPSSYGVKHSATLVATFQARPFLHLGARYGYATGRAYTAVTGATHDAATGRWAPVFGENRSARMPDHQRLDLRLTQLFTLPAGAGLPASGVCAAYVEGLNVLGIRNVLDYAYSADYSSRSEVESYFSRRMLVVGLALTW